MIMAMRVQVELRAKGFYTGTIDGYMTEATKGALRRFQQSRRLSETGVMDNATLAALGVSC
jgi:His-Xaa-Ser repeat protein HxsA